MAEKIIIFSGKQYSGKDTVAKVLLQNMTDYKRCAMGDIIKLEDTLITGYYKVTDMRHTGDWRGASWYSELRCSAIEKVVAK